MNPYFLNVLLSDLLPLCLKLVILGLMSLGNFLKKLCLSISWLVTKLSLVVAQD